MADGSSNTVERLPDWGAERPRGGLGPVWMIAGAEGAIAAVGALVVSRILTGEWTWWFPLFIGIGLSAIVLFRAFRMGRAALAAASAKPMGPGEAPRLSNILDGLVSELGATAPKLWWVEGPGPNALACWSKGPHIGVTKALADECTRTESEAALAFCLVRLVSGEAHRSTLLLGAGPAGPEKVGSVLDTAAAALTRYPPGLARLLERCSPVSGRFAALWISGSDATHEPAAERIAALNDL